MQITGKVKQVFPSETKGNFTFRVLWLATELESQYPQILEIQAAGNKVSILDGLNEGDEVTCHLNLRGREWSNNGTVKVFNTIQTWKVDKSAAGNTPQAAPTAQQEPTEEATPGTVDDIPF